MKNVVKSKEASDFTKKRHQEVSQSMPFNDVEDFENAKKGFIGSLHPVKIEGEKGKINWDLEDYSFISEIETTEDDSPKTVHPSLWRKAKLNMNAGLYKVTEGVYQVRGFDLSNMTIIEGETGIIITDTLISTETAHAALELYYQYRPQKPIVCIIYTHSHADHYGGTGGLVSKEDVKSGKVKLIAPDNFTMEAISENVFSGNAMIRRAEYIYGSGLTRGIYGQVDAGLGKTASKGTLSFIEPTDIIKENHEIRIVDGVMMEFILVPKTEAPTEFVIYFPELKLLNIAEIAVHTMHNILTPRGAQIRDSYAWWKDLDKIINVFKNDYEICIGQHHWPTWGNAEINEMLEHQRDMYKFIHDQTLHFINKGFTMHEAAEAVKLPKTLEDKWYLRGHYGTLNFNVKAVYQFYLGWYSGHPSDLYPLPPEQSAKKYVELMGGIDNVVKAAEQSFAEGDYRWVSELLKHAVFADEHHEGARQLLADAYEQLGYQSESALWRNMFLTGAAELRHVPPKTVSSGVGIDVIEGMPFELLLDFLGIRLNSKRAENKEIVLNLKLTDSEQSYHIEVRNSILFYRNDAFVENADVTLITTREACNQIFAGTKKIAEIVAEKSIKIEGDISKLQELMSLLDGFDPVFSIVTP